MNKNAVSKLLTKKTMYMVLLSFVAFVLAYLLDRYYVYNEKSTFFRNLFTIFSLNH